MSMWVKLYFCYFCDYFWCIVDCSLKCQGIEAWGCSFSGGCLRSLLFVYILFLLANQNASSRDVQIYGSTCCQSPACATILPASTCWSTYQGTCQSTCCQCTCCATGTTCYCAREKGLFCLLMLQLSCLHLPTVVLADWLTAVVNWCYKNTLTNVWLFLVSSDSMDSLL